MTKIKHKNIAGELAEYVSAVCLIVSLLSCSGFSDDCKVKKTAPPVSGPVKDSIKSALTMQNNDTLEITARLIEIPGTMLPNDLYNYVYIMKYRVLSIIKGIYNEKEIYVGHYNPLIPRRLIKDKMVSLVSGNIGKFTVGAKHHLTLITPIEDVWKDAVEDGYVEIEQPRFFALAADELN